jgi:hypothetical protein
VERDGFIFLRHLDLHEPEGAARLFFREAFGQNIHAARL